jgi:hypothetical protein
MEDFFLMALMVEHLVLPGQALDVCMNQAAAAVVVQEPESYYVFTPN